MSEKALTERELTYQERATWGRCPVCGAESGEPCDPDQGITLGSQPKGTIGVHLGRLMRAPIHVKREP